MNISNRVLLFVLSLVVGAISIIIILLPFNQFVPLSVDNISYFLYSIKGNYLYSLVGLLILIVCIKGMISSIRTRTKDEGISYIINMTDYGEVKISSETIVGLVNYVCNKFTGLKDTKVRVNIIDGQIIVYLEGKVIPEVNIPEVTEELQSKVKEHVEKSAGVIVSETRVVISSVTAPVRDIK